MKWSAIFAMLLVVPNAFATDQSGNHFLVGNWIWTWSKNNCTENYTFRPDGTAYFVSGDEKFDMKYALSGTTNPDGRRALLLDTVKDHGGKGCVDSTENETGKSYSLYVEFSNSKTMMKICHDEVSGKCYGPIRKLTNDGK